MMKSIRIKNGAETKNGKERNKRESSVLCSVAAAVAAFVLVCCAAVSVHGWNLDRKTQEREACFAEKEEELKRAVREYLNENGFPNSGIMLTRTVCEDGSRTYTLTVHHDRIDMMSEESRELLAKELMALCFEDEGCTFQSEFLLQQICRN